MTGPFADQIANPLTKEAANPLKEQLADVAADPGRRSGFGIEALLRKLVLPKWAVPRFLRPGFLRSRPRPLPGKAAVQQAAPSAPRRQPRWTADGWALVRGGQAEPALAVGAAAYGGSQAGAVLRYNLAPSSRLRPQVFVRVTAPLAGPGRQGEGAVGLMLRPVQRVPLAIMGEMRVQENGGDARVRPVITAITEIPPLRLPLKAEGEVYAQAGWAGGRGATPFYDMSALVQRCVVEPGGVQLRAGGGLWSGGQRGAVRLDLGPRLELRGMIGRGERRVGVRLSADWRFRIAGQAEPGSGPAITLAAGF